MPEDTVLWMMMRNVVPPRWHRVRSQSMPPTVRGFVGLDLLLGDCVSEDCVIEINPRLTTSYVGLRRMIHGNLAARLFDLETGPVSCCTRR